MKISWIGKSFATLILLAAASACSTDSDGVPKIEDPRSPVVNGKNVRPLEFIATYCRNREKNDTCGKVRAAIIEGSTQGVAPRF